MQWRCPHAPPQHQKLQATTRPEVGTWALAKRQQIATTGIDAANTKAFNHFRTWCNLYNEQCQSPDPPQVAVSVFVAAVRKLGDSISGKLEYELLRTHAGPADIGKVITSIKTVQADADDDDCDEQSPDELMWVKIPPGADGTHISRRRMQMVNRRARSWSTRPSLQSSRAT